MEAEAEAEAPFKILLEVEAEAEAQFKIQMEAEAEVFKNLWPIWKQKQKRKDFEHSNWKRKRKRFQNEALPHPWLK